MMMMTGLEERCPDLVPMPMFLAIFSLRLLGNYRCRSWIQDRTLLAMGLERPKKTGRQNKFRMEETNCVAAVNCVR